MCKMNQKERPYCSEHFEIIDSTQKEIWRRIQNDNIKNKTLVSTDIQTDGVGTHGRIWHTDEKNNIAFSFYYEINQDVSYLEGLTYEIAQIFVDIFKENYNITLKIKLPNDLVSGKDNKKIGGILCESKILGNVCKFLVIGIGINTNKTVFSDDIKDIATSIKKEFGIEIDNQKIIKEFCVKFENYMNIKLHTN